MFSLVVILVMVLCESKFFVYDWPDIVVNRWPLNNSHHRLSLGAGFADNFGTGVILNTTMGMHHTHQYSLFKTFYFRLLESPYRTLDPAEASQFFIPYDLGMDASTRRHDGALYKTNCPMMQTAVDLLRNSLFSGEINYFLRNNGHDHFILHSINQMMLYYADMKCMDIYRFCLNCTKLSIDSYGPGIFNVIDTNKFLQQKWVSIPFPSNFHRSPAVNVFPWSTKSSSRRLYALSYMGTNEVTARLQKSLRKHIRRACRLIPKDCLLVDLNSHLSNALTITDDMSAYPYLLSRFCLMPGGDFPTRKGVLDALLSGCIPVTFHLSTAHYQWLWHWGSLETAHDCMILVNREAAVANMTATLVRLIKLSHNHTLIASKQACIQRVALRMQYNLPNAHEVARARLQAFPDEKWPSVEGRSISGNNIKLSTDAVDVILEKLIFSTKSV